MAEQSVFERMIGAVIGSYRLEQLLTQDDLGPVFQARNASSNAQCRLRLLPTRGLLGQDGGTAYLQEVAGRIAALRHPYVLPLQDFGLYRGMPYLVWPHAAMRPVSVRIQTSGPTDVVTAGRYIDQIAAALEHAHERSVLHLNLTANSVYIQLDGQLMVADFGVRQLFEATATPQQIQALVGMNDACAPEQVLGRTVGAYTDVYALGALTVRLLTGHPVFSGRTRDDVAQQHVYVQVPPVSTWRQGLPSVVDSVLAAALAKSPEERFQRAGAFANAYHEVIDPAGANRLPFVANPLAESAPPPSRPPSRTPSPPLPPPETPSGVMSASGTGRGTRISNGRTSGVRRATPAPRGAGLMLRGRDGVARVAVLVGLVVVLVVGGLFVLIVGRQGGGGGEAAGATGTVVFVDASSATTGLSNRAQVTIHNLGAPSSGQHYAAWIVNSSTENVEALGSLAAKGDGFTVSGPSNGSTNLLGAGDKIIITLETGDSKVPVGHVVMSGAFPALSFVHVQHLLVSYPTTPGKVGLLVGTLEQSQQLQLQSVALENFFTGGNTAGVRCAAQSMIDIVEGSSGAHYRKLGPECAAANVALEGDGYGLLGAEPAADHPGYLDAAAEHASLAVTQSDASAAIREHAPHVATALANVKGWVIQLDTDAANLLAHPGDVGAEKEILQLADKAYHGVPDSPDATAAPDAGKAGAITAYDHGQYMATLPLTPAP